VEGGGGEWEKGLRSVVCGRGAFRDACAFVFDRMGFVAAVDEAL
jgi:hypothetical protein